METDTIVMYVIALILGMLVANMFKDVCGCKATEGLWVETYDKVEYKEDTNNAAPCCGPTPYCNGKLAYSDCHNTSGCTWNPTCPVPCSPQN